MPNNAEIVLASVNRRAITDDTVVRFVDEVVDILKAEALQAVVRTVAADASIATRYQPITVGGKQYDTVGKVVADWFDTMPVEKRSILHTNLQAWPTPVVPGFGGLPSIPLRTFPRLTELDVTNRSYVLEQANLASRFSFVTPEYMTSLIRFIAADLSDVVVDPGQAPSKNAGLKFRVREIYCVDETNPEWGGDDEISCGGVAVDDKEQEKLIKEFDVRSFSDGKTKTYNPPKELASFVLDNQYPKNFAVFLSLAEKDAGGFADFLEKLYEAIKAELNKILVALGAAVGAQIGAALGGSAGTAIGGPIGTIIGTVAGLILGALVGWLVASLRDDIFEPQMAALSLPSAEAAFAGGSLASPAYTLTYQDFGGKYRLKYDWALVRA